MSANKKYVVRLTDEEREGLEAMVRKGRAAAYKIRHANVDVAFSPSELRANLPFHGRSGRIRDDGGRMP